MLLRFEDKNRLLALFKQSTLMMEIWAFGSRVSGDAHNGSDLDLVIRSKTLQPLPLDELLLLKEKIGDSNVSILVDIFDWARLPQSFHQNIEENHEVLYSNLN